MAFLWVYDQSGANVWIEDDANDFPLKRDIEEGVGNTEVVQHIAFKESAAIVIEFTNSKYPNMRRPWMRIRSNSCIEVPKDKQMFSLWNLLNKLINYFWSSLLCPFSMVGAYTLIRLTAPKLVWSISAIRRSVPPLGCSIYFRTAKATPCCLF